jgi:hypothetical protein
MRTKIINDILRVSQQLLSKVPISKKDYKTHGNYSIETVKKHMGSSWTQAMVEIFGVAPHVHPPKPKNKCLKCGRETKNPKFCSSSCSASYLNTIRVIGRKHKGNCCIICNKKITPRRIKCDECQFFIKTKNGYKPIHDVTIDDILTTDTQKYRRIRIHANKIAKENGLLDQCILCGYNKHVECSHIVPIKNFPKTTLIKVVNHLSNLQGLCPNCHWEFDNLTPSHPRTI